MAVITEFVGQDAGLAAEQDRIAESAGRIDEQYRNAAREARELERSATRAFNETRTPLERYNQQMERLNRLLAEGKIDQDTYARSVKQATDELEAQGQEGEQALSKVKGGLDSVLAVLGIGGVGIAGALQTITQGYQTWLENTREIAEETRQAANELIAFAALQEGGTRAERVRLAQESAIEFGITDRGEAFDTVQALQSVRGTFEEGLSAAREVFAAAQVGIPVELGRELEVFGAAQGEAAGTFLRQAFVAGEASGRDPRALARAAPAISFFDDAAFGFATASQLAGAVRSEQLETIVRATGRGLSDTGGAIDFFNQNLGEGASQLERLRLLQERGITTPAQLQQIGVTDVEQQRGLSVAIERLNELVAAQTQIERDARAGLFASERAGVEAELQQFIAERAIRQQEAGFDAARAANIESLRQEFFQRALGRRLAERGIEQVGTFDVIDPEGRTTGVDQLQVLLGLAVTRTPRIPGLVTDFAEARQAAVADLERLDKQLAEAEKQTQVLEKISDGVQTLNSRNDQQIRERQPQPSRAQ